MSKEIEFWTKGKADSIACISGYAYEDGVIELSAERDRITKAQFNKAIKAHFPEAERISAIYSEDWWLKAQVTVDQEHISVILED